MALVSNNQPKLQALQALRTPLASALPAAPVQPKPLGDTLNLATPKTLTPPPAPQAEAPKGLLGRLFKPAASNFNQLVEKNPAAVWSKELTPFTKAALAAYQRGDIGRSVRGLDLRGQPVGAIRQELLRRGFKMEKTELKDFKTGKPLLNPSTGKAIPMEVWSNKDGGLVRLKPQGDPTSKHRPQPHASVSVKYPPDASGHDFNHEAFKVDYNGNPLPKWAKDAHNPFGDTAAGKQFLDDLASRTHTDLA